MRILAVTSLLLCCTAGCKCIPAPNSDGTAPTAGLIVAYMDAAGVARTHVHGNAAPATTLDSRRDTDVSVLMVGADPEGLRSVHIDTRIQEDLGGDIGRAFFIDRFPKTSNCPVKAMFDSAEYPATAVRRTITIIGSSENWLRTRTTGNALTVNQN